MPLKKRRSKRQKQANLFLAVDVGNTSTDWGVFHNKKLILRLTSLTGKSSSAVFKRLRPYRKKMRQAVICSVVPRESDRLVKTMRRSLGLSAKVLGRDLRVPIANKVRKPRQVGMDRLVNALASYEVFKQGCVCVDFGTAITFDVISTKGEYEGGIIAPGIELTLNALAEKTALLPRIRLQHVRRVVGQDTISSIRSGCSVGLGALCDGILNQIDQEKRRKHKVVATGGYARFISRYSRKIQRVRDHLTLEGIRLSFERQSKDLTI